MTLLPIRRFAIVTHPRGTWKWQNAYRVMRYRPRKTLDGRWIWESDSCVVGKSSLPQLRWWKQQPNVSMGSLHNHPLDEDEIKALMGDEILADSLFSIG